MGEKPLDPLTASMIKLAIDKLPDKRVLLVSMRKQKELFKRCILNGLKNQRSI